MKTINPESHPNGFALVITLSLMILLTIVAVGLLSLSAISLRASSQGDAMATARANARLALMLAIGDLQKHAGPDRAVTATSEILTTPATVPLPNPTPPGCGNHGGISTRAQRRITPPRKQIVSGAGWFPAPTWRLPRQETTPPHAWKPAEKTIELVGKGSLGTGATAAAKATAGLVPVSKNGKVQGSYAWHVCR